MGQRDLPLASGKEHIKAFKRLGLDCARKKAKDAHFVVRRAGHRHVASIPDHKEVKRALLQKQIKLLGFTEQQYLDAFNAHGSGADEDEAA